MSKQYYTYLYLRNNGIPYYAGKGSGNRAFHPYKRRLSVPESNHILIEYHDTEQEAFEAEMFLIAYYGRRDNGTGCLRNLTDGGENPPKNPGGRKFSAQACENIRQSKLGSTNPKSSITKRGKPAHNKGCRMSDISRQKMRLAKLGKPGPNLGRTIPEETRHKISLSLKGKKRMEFVGWQKRSLLAKMP